MMSFAKRIMFKSYVIDDDSIVVRITHPNELPLTGILNVKSIYGCVEILGWKLSPNDSSITVYSIKEYCALKIKLLPNERYDFDKIESRLQEFCIPPNLSQEILADFSPAADHLLLVKKHLQLQEHVNFFRFYELPVFLKENFDVPIEHFVRAEPNEIFMYQNVGKRNYYHEQHEWNVLCDSILSRENCQVVLCGGKGVGKSTLLRYLINKCLKKWPKILVLDFDPGQSEFTVTGCLSAILVQQPLLGPNFLHLIDPIRCLFLGVTSVEDSYNLYVNYTTRLIDECRSSYNDIPWIINTMGFVTGQGFTILKNVIENVQPTDVVQIKSNKKYGNFTPSLLSKHTENNLFDDHSPLDYKLHSLVSVPDNLTTPSGICGLSSIMKRNIVSLFYFFPILNGGLGLWIPTPLKISLQRVDIIIEKPSSRGLQISLVKWLNLCCLNGNLVALCLKEEENILHCLGFGIIRGIDEEKDELYVITPLENDKLENVNVIRLSSSIQLPDVVYKKQLQFMEKSVPFVTYKRSADHLNEPIKKSSSRIKHP